MPKIFTRSASDSVVAGVCGGIAEYTDRDPRLVRFVCAIALLLTLPVGLFVYVLMVFWFPRTPRQDAA